MLLLNFLKKYFDMKKIVLSSVIVLIFFFVGCSFGLVEKQCNFELLVGNCVSLFLIELLLEFGLLNIFCVIVKGSIVELMMVYNMDVNNVKLIE